MSYVADFRDNPYQSPGEIVRAELATPPKPTNPPYPWAELFKCLLIAVAMLAFVFMVSVAVIGLLGGH